MATMQGITGKLSGKMGSAVFRVREGQQVVTQYNPIVKNPNTEGQQSNRASFKLMSQLAAIMSPALGGFATTAKSGKGKPTQRNEFLRVNYPLVTTSDESTGVVAKIPMEQLQLTSSYRTLGLLIAQEIQEGNTLSAEVFVVDTSITMVRFTVVTYVKYGDMSVIERPARASLVDIVDIPVEDGKAVLSYDIEKVGGGDFTILTYGLIPSESGSVKTDLDNIHTPNEENFISAVNLETMISAGAIAVTETQGANVSFSLS